MELGLTPGQLADFDPEDFPPLFEAWKRRQEREDYRAGVVASILANVHRDSKTTPPYSPASFFSSLADMFPPDDGPSDEELERRLEAVLGGLAQRSSS